MSYDYEEFESNADRAMRERLEALEAENARLKGKTQQQEPDPAAALHADLAAIPDTVTGPDGTVNWNPDAPRLIAEAVMKAGGTISGVNAHQYRR